MKQLLQDLALRLQKERKAQFIAGIIVLMLVFVVLGDHKSSVKPSVPIREEPEEISTGKMSNEEAYSDIVQRFTVELEENKKKTDELLVSQKDMNRKMGENEQRTAEIFRKVLERIQEQDERIGAGKQPPVGPQDVPPEDLAAAPSDQLTSFAFETETNVAPTPATPGRVAFVGAGDSVRIKLLAGVNAPTDGTPYPVVFKLMGDVYGPDGSALPLGEARLIAAAQGSLTDSRALFRLTSLNLQFPDGRRKVFDVDGWVVGEDGLRGMQGVLIDPIGKAIGGYGMAGAIGGVGDAIASKQVTVQTNPYGGFNQMVTGDVATYAAGRGIAGAAGAWSEIIKDRITQLVPHVQVLSGREATAVFSRSIAIEGLYEALSDGEDNVYAQLD